MSDCLICERLSMWEANTNPYFIHEFPHSIFVVGDHQYFRGYSLLLYKQHVRELHDLPQEVQTTLFQEVMVATNAIVQTFQPYKMNHLSAGNAEPHVHWHLLPRRADEESPNHHPFVHVDQFNNYRITADEAQRIAARIRQHITI